MIVNRVFRESKFFDRLTELDATKKECKEVISIVLKLILQHSRLRDDGYKK